MRFCNEKKAQTNAINFRIFSDSEFEVVQIEVANLTSKSKKWRKERERNAWKYHILCHLAKAVVNTLKHTCLGKFCGHTSTEHWIPRIETHFLKTNAFFIFIDIRTTIRRTCPIRTHQMLQQLRRSKVFALLVCCCCCRIRFTMTCRWCVSKMTGREESGYWKWK